MITNHKGIRMVKGEAKKINTDYKRNSTKLLHGQDSPMMHKTRRCSFETRLNVDSELLYPKGIGTFESMVFKAIRFLFPLLVSF